jgi:hypothetical protein
MCAASQRICDESGSNRRIARLHGEDKANNDIISSNAIKRRDMRTSGTLRLELSARNQHIATTQQLAHELTAGDTPSVIFGAGENNRHGNFHPVSYRNICADPSWARRLEKVHTSSRRTQRTEGRRWRELDCANSSDALLMNAFCYRRLLSGALATLLGIDAGVKPEFGFRPHVPLRDGKTDRTEIDMRLGSLLVEAKLTETNFQTAPARLVERYRDFHEVFDTGHLLDGTGQISSYQLIRSVLAAYSTGYCFCVLCDARRPDLIERWYGVLRTVRSCALRCRLKLLTWQELNLVLPSALQRFLASKYGI